MTSHPQDYINYMHVSPSLELWGVNVVASGRRHVASGAEYPAQSEEHPLESQMTWDKGWALDVLKIVFIKKGQGAIEYRAGELLRVETGSIFIVLPGQWHRYRPDPATGWEESWVEIRGPLVERLVASREFSGQAFIRQSRIGGRIDFVLELIHSKARTLTSTTPELSAYGMQILAFWLSEQAESAGNPHMAWTMDKAERILSSRCMESINIPDIARELGVAYSHFRREFKKRTGYSPWQYVLKMRLTRVCRLLLTSEMTLEQMATTVGFNSSFHLSSQFKKVYGVSPRKWREQRMGQGVG